MNHKRKTKIAAVVMAAALTVSSIQGGGMEKVTVTKAETTTAQYHAYSSFQLGGYWITRTIWNDKQYGRSDVIKKTSLKINKKTYDYDYTKHFLAFNTEDTGVNDGGITDAVITGDGEYTLELSNFPTTSFTNRGDASWGWLSISTDIPLTEKDVKCSNAKVYLDGSETPLLSLESAPQSTEKDSNGGCYNFYLIDAYRDNHGTKGAADPDKYKKFPTKSLKITFSISGVKLAASPQQSAAPGTTTAPQAPQAPQDKAANNSDTKTSVDKVGSVIKKGGITYKITKKSSGKTAGEVQVTKSSKAKVTVPARISNNGSVYRVTSLSSKAFADSKKLVSIVTGSEVKRIPDRCFDGCKKLKKVVLGKKTTSIGNKAFRNCVRLEKVKAAGKVKTAKNAFAGCKIKKVTR